MAISVFDRVENAVGKGEIVCTAISLFPTMFSKGFFPDPLKGVIVWEWVKRDRGWGESIIHLQQLLFVRKTKF